MAEPTTPNKGLTIPNTGDLANAWGPVLNANFSLLDSFLSATTSVAVSSGSYALSGSSAQVLRIQLTGNLTGAVTIIVPQLPGYFYFHDQTTRNGFTITVTTGSTSGRTQNLPSRLSHLFSDGADVYLVTEPNHGELKPYSGGTPPPLWGLCYGQAVSRTTYADLFNAIGTTWGAGDGSTTFNLPDLRGRALFGADAMGGTAANRLTTASLGAAAALGVAGGSELLQAHAHTVNDPGHNHTQNPHVHTVVDPGHNHGVNDPGHNHGVNDPGHVHPMFTQGGPYGTAGSGADYVANSIEADTNGAVGTKSATTGISLNSATTGITLSAALTGISLDSATATNNATTTGITLADAGTGASQNTPPAAVVNHLIYMGQ